MATTIQPRITKAGVPQRVHLPHRPCGRSTYGAYTSPVPADVTCVDCLRAELARLEALAARPVAARDPFARADAAARYRDELARGRRR